MDNSSLGSRTEERFIAELRHHLAGWLAKVTTDLSAESFKHEIERLGQDPVYRAFGLASPEYALVRLMGRLSISFGRRLGEIYDKIPRFITQARFSLGHEDVAPKMGGRLELDVCVPLARLGIEDKKHVIQVARFTSPRRGDLKRSSNRNPIQLQSQRQRQIAEGCSDG